MTSVSKVDAIAAMHAGLPELDLRSAGGGQRTGVAVAAFLFPFLRHFYTENCIVFRDSMGVPGVTPIFDSRSSEETMKLFSQLRQGFLCMRGSHRGGNFCIYCGKQLTSEPFFSFRVLAGNGQLNVVVKALNEHHAKWLLNAQHPPSKLVAQRIADE